MMLKSMLALALLTAAGTAFADVETGSFSMTLTGCTSNPSATVQYVKDTDSGFTQLVLPALYCTSNAITGTLTGLPSNLYPSAQQIVPVNLLNYGSQLPGQMKFNASSGTVNLYVFPNSGGLYIGDGNFVSTGGTKGFGTAGTLVSYFSVL